MTDPTLAYWAGFATCLTMVAVIVVLAAVRMAGLCAQAERERDRRLN